MRRALAFLSAAFVVARGAPLLAETQTSSTATRTATSAPRPLGSTPETPGTPGPGADETRTGTIADAGASLGEEALGAETSEPEPSHGYDVVVRATRRPPSRGASDFTVDVGALRSVPRANASDFLKLAPGVVLTNEGGEGHAERVYMRGFDAREGQDVEFLVDGVPFNEVGNPHGEGYADTHFIIPELVQSVRVLEGPFDPTQGNYAVAGSADYHLGVDSPGLSIAYGVGSFGTHRLLTRYGSESPHSFVGADVRTTNGFGASRAALLGRGLGQLELDFGPADSLRLFAAAYVTRFSQAGVIRADDYQAGRIDFYGTYDPSLGGDMSRFSAAADYQHRGEGHTLRQLLFVTLRDFRLRSNFTGFLLDPPEPFRSGFGQRGDATDQTYSAATFGARGSIREARTFFGRKQALEAGYYARLDRADSAQRRLRFNTVIPYRVDFDLGQTVTNLALYVDTELRPLDRVVLRGGVRGDLFHFNVLNRCDLHDTDLGSAAPVQDLLCYDLDRNGPRDPTARRTARGLIIQPRGTVVVGPFEGVSLSASVGRGSRAADPSYLADGNDAPFAEILAADGGVSYATMLGDVSLSARSLYFWTRVSRDLIFNQQEGRNTLAPGTLRQGGILALRAVADFFDVSGSATLARATFQREEEDPGATYFPPDTGNRVPFIGNLVLRGDGALFGALPGLTFGGDALQGRLGVGASYMSPRALPYEQLSDPFFLVDASAGLRWRIIDLDLSITNLLGSKQKLAELNYVSEFRQDTPTPNLVPERHFTANAPRTVLFTLTLHVGDLQGETP